jgi:hypothetical protein
VGIFGFGPNDIFAVGAAYTLLHWNGTRWGRMARPQTSGPGSYLAVWGRSRTEVWAVGTSGHIAHFDGTEWTAMKSDTTVELRGVAGVSDRVFAIGYPSTLLEYGP